MSQWILVGKLIGTRVPEQIVVLNDLYGTGGFSSRERPRSAGFHICTADLGDHVIRKLAELREIKENHPSRVQCPLYFDKGGFLPVGRIADDIEVGLMAIGTNSDQWKVALLRPGVRRFQITNLGVIDFLISMAEGSLVNDLFSDSMRKQNSFAFWADNRSPWPYGIGEVNSSKCIE
jgi:hypothetical protein